MNGTVWNLVNFQCEKWDRDFFLMIMMTYDISGLLFSFQSISWSIIATLLCSPPFSAINHSQKEILTEDYVIFIIHLCHVYVPLFSIKLSSKILYNHQSHGQPRRTKEYWSFSESKVELCTHLCVGLSLVVRLCVWSAKMNHRIPKYWSF